MTSPFLWVPLCPIFAVTGVLACSLFAVIYFSNGSFWCTQLQVAWLPCSLISSQFAVAQSIAISLWLNVGHELCVCEMHSVNIEDSWLITYLQLLYAEWYSIWSLADPPTYPHPLLLSSNPSQKLIRCRWSPDGRMVAAGSSDRSAYTPPPPACVYEIVWYRVLSGKVQCTGTVYDWWRSWLGLDWPKHPLLSIVLLLKSVMM